MNKKKRGKLTVLSKTKCVETTIKRLQSELLSSILFDLAPSQFLSLTPLYLIKSPAL